MCVCVYVKRKEDKEEWVCWFVGLVGWLSVREKK